MAVFDNPENLTKVTQLISTADEYTGGWLGSIILIILGFGVFLLTSQFSSRQSLVASTFVTFVFALILRFFFENFLGDAWLYGTFILFIGALIFAFISKEDSGA